LRGFAKRPIFAISVTSAVAADLAPQPVEPVVPVVLTFSWTGFYVGAQAGYAWGDSKASYPIAGPAGFLDLDPDGGFGGVYAGYNYEFSNGLVVGLDGDVNYGSVSGKDIYHVVGGGVLARELTPLAALPVNPEHRTRFRDDNTEGPHLLSRHLRERNHDNAL